MTARALLLCTMAGCLGGPASGTAVGNPGDADVKVSRVDPALALERVALPTSALRLLGCDGTERLMEQELSLDGLAPSTSRLVVPGGTWCELTLELAGPVQVEGSTAAGTVFSVQLDAGELLYAGELAVDGQHLLFELPLPLDPAVLEALGPQVQLPADDPAALGWARDAASGVSLWEDADEDGLLSQADLELVPWGGSGPPSAYQAEDGGCGCRGGPSGGGLLGLLLLGLLKRSRLAPMDRDDPRAGRRCEVVAREPAPGGAAPPAPGR
jgi:MYXO-CTERM domain-containing protein